MPKYWLISDRNNGGTWTDRNVAGLTYFVSDTKPLSDINNWSRVTGVQFQRLLRTATDGFPALPPGQNENQSHVTILIHGYNVSFESATGFYEKVCSSLYEGDDSLGLCILYDWPSVGQLLGYEPDRAHARECAPDLTNVLSTLYDWLMRNQQAAIKSKGDPKKACRAKVSVIAHSMGNYLLQKAMIAAWTRKNQPLLTSLINQLLMVAADVDNDLFDAGAPDNDDGSAIVNLTYRITALYSGRDAVLGASAGLKHFGTRRLGRSGLAHRPPSVTGPPATDNVWDVDCSDFFPQAVDGEAVHGAYFDYTIDLMRKILRGIDRGVLEQSGATVAKTAMPA